MRTRVLAGAGAALTAGALVAAAGWADGGAGPRTSEAGATTVFYKGPRIQVAVSCRYPRYHPVGNWLLLDVEMGAAGGPIRIPRGAVAVRTPRGDVVPLATQQEFAAGYAELASPIRLADLHRERLGYLLPERIRPLNLFRVNGVGWVWPWVLLDPFHNCYGRLYFHLPGGVTTGRYELVIRLGEEEVAIPFNV